MIYFLKKISIIYYFFFPRTFGFGYNQYKYSVIKKKIIYGNNSVKLREYLDERIVEIPWIINKLKSTNNKKILDVGCTLNFKYLIDLFLKKNKIFFINLFKEKNNYFSNQISYIQNDIRNSALNDKYFDIVTAISVLEHIGFDNSIYNYEFKKNNTINKQNYKKALLEIKRVLKKGGKFFMTVPFGKKQIFDNYMQFDHREINNIIKIFKPSKYKIEYYYFNKLNKCWSKTNPQRCKNNIANSKGKIGICSNSVALIEIIK